MGKIIITHSKININIMIISMTASVLLSVGIYLFSRSLRLIQEISSKPNKEGDLRLEALVGEIVKTTLAEKEKELDQKATEQVEIKFLDEPFSAERAEELSIKFRVRLTQGRVLRNLAVWFFVPDDIALVQPAEELSWRQGPDYNPPNIRTVKITIGDISIGPYTPGTLKIKTPSLPGSYSIYYRLYGEGYQQDKRQVISIEVR